jgi:hypothetical protein
MVEPIRHRQTKGAATDMFDLKPPRHTSTLPILCIRLAGVSAGQGGLRSFTRTRPDGEVAPQAAVPWYPIELR